MTEIKEHNGEPEGEDIQISMTVHVPEDTHIDLAPTQNKFFELENLFNTSRYFDTLSAVEDALLHGRETKRKLEGIVLSYALLSTEKLIFTLNSTHILDLDLRLKRANELLTKAKKDYNHLEYGETQNTLHEIKVLTARLSEKHNEGIEALIEGVERDMEDAKGFGADVRESAWRIKRARELLAQGQSVASCDAVSSARDFVAKAKSDRVKVISQAISFVEDLMKDATAIGADAQGAFQELERAKSQLSENEFQLCMHSIIKAEQLVYDLISMQVKRAKDLEQSLLSRLKEVESPRSFENEENSLPSDENEAANVQKMCPECQNPIEYYESYGKWYCAYCMHYL